MLQDVLANEISIHAPRAGRDRRVSRASKAPRISIHAPRAGRDRRLRLYRADPEISIHAPRAGRDMRDDSAYSIRRHISIHAPRAGRNVIILRIRIEQSAFQSTRPVRGATCMKQSRTFDLHISIHAPRAGRDAASHAWSMGPANFNPRAPCGARHTTITKSSNKRKFQSTRPVRGATITSVETHSRKQISIHAPRAGRDKRKKNYALIETYFNPRAPCGARLPVIPHKPVGNKISIHAPRAGRDVIIPGNHNADDISIHAPRAGRDSKSIQNYFTHFCDKRQFLDNFTQNAAF